MGPSLIIIILDLSLSLSLRRFGCFTSQLDRAPPTFLPLLPPPVTKKKKLGFYYTICYRRALSWSLSLIPLFLL